MYSVLYYEGSYYGGTALTIYHNRVHEKIASEMSVPHSLGKYF